jgi:hypothetical protein
MFYINGQHMSILCYSLSEIPLQFLVSLIFPLDHQQRKCPKTGRIVPKTGHFSKNDYGVKNGVKHYTGVYIRLVAFVKNVRSYYL